MARWKGRKIDHLSLRVLALFLAIILWFLATGRPQNNLSLDQTIVEAALGVENVRGDLVVTERPVQVELTLEGPRLILPFQAQEVEAYLDLADLGAGRHQVPVAVRAPGEIAVKSVRPEEATVVLEERVKRTVAVRVAVRSVLPGTAVAVLDVRPATMDVYGPTSAVNRVEHILAEIMSAGKGNGTVKAVPVPVDGEGERVGNVATGLDEVIVELAVEERTNANQTKTDG